MDRQHSGQICVLLITLPMAYHDEWWCVGAFFVCCPAAAHNRVGTFVERFPAVLSAHRVPAVALVARASSCVQPLHIFASGRLPY